DCQMIDEIVCKALKRLRVNLCSLSLPYGRFPLGAKLTSSPNAKLMSCRRTRQMRISNLFTLDSRAHGQVEHRSNTKLFESCWRALHLASCSSCWRARGLLNSAFERLKCAFEPLKRAVGVSTS